MDKMNFFFCISLFAAAGTIKPWLKPEIPGVDLVSALVDPMVQLYQDSEFFPFI